jgi:enoyl-CoA hydratase/3-hydroxyacyl-CoA dehydrogenase
MGSGIAQKYASEGYPVVAVDLDEKSLERGRERIRSTLREGVERRIYTPEQAEAILGRIAFHTELSAMADVDLVIEAVFEDLEVKRDVFRRLAEVTSADCVLATNTSSFKVGDLAQVVKGPHRVMGLHYFYHPAKNRLVEVIPGPETPGELLDQVWDLQEAIGKTPILCADAPGFIVNRFFVPWVNEAARMLEEGLADIPTIEEAAKKTFGIGMGPFELMNVTGIPIAYHAASTLERDLGAFYRPAGIIKAQMEKGEPFALDGTPDASRFQTVADRLLGVTFQIVSELVQEGVGSIEDTDIGARVGLRWARGPFQMMNALGVPRAAELARAIQQTYGLSAPKLLEEQARKGEPFPIQVVKTRKADGLGQVILYRPDAMNALDEETMGQLEAAIRELSQDPEVQGIVLKGAGKAFVAGADVKFFVEAMDAGDYERIRAFTERGHRILEAIDQCPKPVIAQLDGVALGGGFELALAADYIVATEKGAMGFPETGIGIYPGLGGTQRTSRRIGVGLTRFLVLTGQILGRRRRSGWWTRWCRVRPSGRRCASSSPAAPQGPSGVARRRGPRRSWNGCRRCGARWPVSSKRPHSSVSWRKGQRRSWASATGRRPRP